MKHDRMGSVLCGVFLMLLGGARCPAQTNCTNTYDVKGIDGKGHAATVSFLLRKPDCDYDEAKRKRDTAAQVDFMGPACELFGNASYRQNCAGFVLDKLWTIGKYNTNAGQILLMAQTFGEQVGKRLNRRTHIWQDDPSSVEVGDIVIYGNADHVAVVAARKQEGWLIESKDNEGAYFRFIDGMQSDGAKSRWGDRAFWHLDPKRILSRGMRTPSDDCPIPTYTLKCPGPVTVDYPTQVPRPDIQGMEKQIKDQRGKLKEGMEWISGWMVDVTNKDADHGGSGHAGDPKRIARTYQAAVYCEKEGSDGALGHAPCATAECIQNITVENKSVRTQRFDHPEYQGYYLDWCIAYLTPCGRPAADAFCKWKGFDRAEAYEKWHVGLSAQTKVISDGSVCNADFCDAFAYIVCKTGK